MEIMAKEDMKNTIARHYWRGYQGELRMVRIAEAALITNTSGYIILMIHNMSIFHIY